MGLQKGIHVRCERCGENDFFVDGGVNSAHDAMRINGWTTRLNRWVCPNCRDLFDQMIDNFFEEAVDK